MCDCDDEPRKKCAASICTALPGQPPPPLALTLFAFLGTIIFGESTDNAAVNKSTSRTSINTSGGHDTNGRSAEQVIVGRASVSPFHTRCIPNEDGHSSSGGASARPGDPRSGAFMRGFLFSLLLITGLFAASVMFACKNCTRTDNDSNPADYVRSLISRVQLVWTSGLDWLRSVNWCRFVGWVHSLDLCRFLAPSSSGGDGSGGGGSGSGSGGSDSGGSDGGSCRCRSKPVQPPKDSCD